jgi:hypothetical protein
MRRAILLAIPLIGAAIGYLISVIVGAPPGPGHSCPFGAPPSACEYPPDTARWALVWTAGGLLVGIVVTVIVAAVLARSARPTTTA